MPQRQGKGPCVDTLRRGGGAKRSVSATTSSARAASRSSEVGCVGLAIDGNTSGGQHSNADEDVPPRVGSGGVLTGAACGKGPGVAMGVGMGQNGRGWWISVTAAAGGGVGVGGGGGESGGVGGGMAPPRYGGKFSAREISIGVFARMRAFILMRGLNCPHDRSMRAWRAEVGDKQTRANLKTLGCQK